MYKALDMSSPYYKRQAEQREKNNLIFLERIKSLSNNVVGVYKHVCLENVKLFAFEVAQQACSSESEKSGIEKAVGKDIVKLALRIFPEAKITDTLETYVYPQKPIMVQKKHSKKLVRIKVYSVNTIFDFIKNNPDEMYYIDEEGNRNKVRRAKVFYEKGVKCVECELTGSFFALEQSTTDKGFHLDLFAIDADGDEVLMTVDHIHAKSKGGKDKMENYQPMCYVCNYSKSDS